MPKRTIYLPDRLDELSRRLGVNLSRLTQQAIEDLAADHRDEVLEADIDAASERVRALGLSWPEDALEAQRREAAER